MSRVSEILKNYTHRSSGVRAKLANIMNTGKLAGTGKMKIAPTEKSLISKAIEIMKKSRTDYFYVTQLIRDISFDSKEIEALYSLIIKRVFNPIS